MDRYKEGYNDCNREWKKKIEDEIKVLNSRKNYIPLDNKYTYKEVIEFGIEQLQDLLKKGSRNMEFQKVFRDYNVNPTDIGYINTGWKYVFPNGYGASVINDGYGKEQRII